MKYYTAVRTDEVVQSAAYMGESIMLSEIVGK